MPHSLDAEEDVCPGFLKCLSLKTTFFGLWSILLQMQLYGRTRQTKIASLLILIRFLLLTRISQQRSSCNIWPSAESHGYNNHQAKFRLCYNYSLHKLNTVWDKMWGSLCHDDGTKKQSDCWVGIEPVNYWETPDHSSRPFTWSMRIPFAYNITTLTTDHFSLLSRYKILPHNKRYSGATILDNSNYKLRPPLLPSPSTFQWWKNGAFCLAREFIIDFWGGGVG